MATMVNLVCEFCNNEFIVKKGREKRFCSKKCKLDYRKRNDEIFYIEKECESCNNLFRSKKKENKKYCSYKCAGIGLKKNSREDRTCLLCGTSFNERIKYKRSFCSEKCRILWKTNPENIKKRMGMTKKSNLEKYGVEHIFQVNDIRLKANIKRKKTYELWGAEISKTITDKNEKHRQNKLTKRFLDIGYIILEFKNENLVVKHPDGHIFENNRKLLVNRLNHGVELSTTLQPVGSPRTTFELKICKYLKTNKIDYISNDRKLIKHELDILMLNHNLAIEINGLHWHCEYYLNDDYHVTKTKKCEDKNVELLHFFEDELIEKYDIIESMINAKLNINLTKIDVSDCIIKECENSISSKFLIKNHIQGNINSSIKIGLYHNNELVSLMTFSLIRNKLRNNNKINNTEYELLRFCNKLNTSIIGAESKLYQYFKTKYNSTKVIGYADRRFDNGSTFKNLNFIFDTETKPTYYYVVGKKRKHKFLFKKDILIKEGFDPNKSERQIMKERKFPRIFDCGKHKYIDY